MKMDGYENTKETTTCMNCLEHLAHCTCGRHSTVDGYDVLRESVYEFVGTGLPNFHMVTQYRVYTLDRGKHYHYGYKTYQAMIKNHPELTDRKI